MCCLGLGGQVALCPCGPSGGVVGLGVCTWSLNVFTSASILVKSLALLPGPPGLQGHNSQGRWWQTLLLSLLNEIPTLGLLPFTNPRTPEFHLLHAAPAGTAGVLDCGCGEPPTSPGHFSKRLPRLELPGPFRIVLAVCPALGGVPRWC